VATEADDAAIRAMLRENGMPTPLRSGAQSHVEMTIEREPSFFAGKDLAGHDWAVIAEEKGDVIGMYTAAVMPVHLNGSPTRLGYLGGLRVNPAHRRRIRYLREGYASIGRFAPENVPWWFTVVAAENEGARRLLEAGVAGLPPYQPQGDYVTYALPVARGRRRGLWRRVEWSADVSSAVAGRPRPATRCPGGTPEQCGRDARAPSEIVDFYNRAAARFQYSPVLSEELAKRLDFYVYGDIEAVAALWDQREFKQIVARRYRRPVGSLVPLYNAYARLFGRIPLPREGCALEQTFIAFLAMSEGADAHALLQDLLSHCRTPAASIGLHRNHPLVPVVERFKPVRYPARIYAVTFNGAPPDSALPAQPEAALL
jgi:hypothetical protein